MIGAYLLMAVLGQVDVSFVEEVFQEETLDCHDADVGVDVLKYRLFVPLNIQAGEKLPLIVWLHGFDEGGENNIRQVRYQDEVVFKDVKDLVSYRFFLLVPQCPSTHLPWFHETKPADGNETSPVDMIDLTARMVDDVSSRYPVDVERISCVGICSGGAGCWEYAVRYGHRLAALAPLAAAGAGIQNLDSDIGFSTWAFYCVGDNPSGLASVRRAVETLQSRNANARLTVFEGATHDCWTPAFLENGLLEWLLLQRRGQDPSIWTSATYVEAKTRLSNAIRRWTWTEAGMQLGYTAAFLGIVLKLRQSWRKKRPTDQPDGSDEAAVALAVTEACDTSPDS